MVCLATNRIYPSSRIEVHGNWSETFVRHPLRMVVAISLVSLQKQYSANCKLVSIRSIVKSKYLSCCTVMFSSGDSMLDLGTQKGAGPISRRSSRTLRRGSMMRRRPTRPRRSLQTFFLKLTHQFVDLLFAKFQDSDQRTHYCSIVQKLVRFLTPARIDR